MSADLSTIMNVASSGLQAQSARMKVVAENIANAQTTAETPGGQPYRRQILSFRDVFDRLLGVHKVKVDTVRPDMSAFTKKYDPSHPAADKDGYVEMPNVKPMIEAVDMRDSQRSYEANLGVIEAARSMLLRTIDLLRS